MEELLQPRHPQDKHHQMQLQALQQPPENQREEMARLFRLGNAAYQYQQLAAGQITEADYQDWLTGLPDRMRQAMEKEGFESCKSSLGLRRHALERRDVGYSAFMKSILSPEDWAFEQEPAKQHSSSTSD
jgi:hypothetical protein